MWLYEGRRVDNVPLLMIPTIRKRTLGKINNNNNKIKILTDK